MSHDLTDLLSGSPLVAPGLRPDVGSLWVEGRARRTRRRAGLAAGVVVLVGLVAGGIALASPRPTHQVDVTGTSTTSTTAPAEPQPPPGPRPSLDPTDEGPQVVASAFDRAEIGGRALVHPGDDFTVSFVRASGWERDQVARWEAWDGRTWTPTHSVLAGPAGESPMVRVGIEDPELVHLFLPVTGTTTYLAPTVGEGWYRLCVPLRYDDVTITERCAPLVIPAGTIVPGVPDLQPPLHEPDPEERRDSVPVPEAQVREGRRLEGRLVVRPGDPIDLHLFGEGFVRDEALGWQAWDGRRWTTVAWVISPIDGQPARQYETEGEPLPHPVFAEGPIPALVPAAQEPGWYRLCVALTSNYQQLAPEDVTGPTDERCAQLVIAEP